MGLIKNILNISEINFFLDDLKRFFYGEPESDRTTVEIIDSTIRNYILKKQAYKINYLYTYIYIPKNKIDNFNNRTNSLFVDVLINDDLKTKCHVILNYVRLNDINYKKFGFDDLYMKAISENQKMIRTNDMYKYYFQDGYFFIKLKTQESYKSEGFLMKNCMASQFSLNNHDYILSLRDKDANPIMNVQVKKNYILQIKEYANREISNKNKKYINKFAKENGLKFKLGFNDNVNFVELIVLLYSSIGLFFTGFALRYLIGILAKDSKNEIFKNYIKYQGSIELSLKLLFIPIFLGIASRIFIKVIKPHLIRSQI